MKESEVLKSVLNKLKTYEFSGDVVWHSRLNSGKINSGNYWVKLCDIGTPDIVVIVNCGNGKISLLFLECKRTKVKKLRYEQKLFFEKMENQPMTLCSVINDPKQLSTLLKKAKKL